VSFFAVYFLRGNQHQHQILRMASSQQSIRTDEATAQDGAKQKNGAPGKPKGRRGEIQGRVRNSPVLRKASVCEREEIQEMAFKRWEKVFWSEKRKKGLFWRHFNWVDAQRERRKMIFPQLTSKWFRDALLNNLFSKALRQMSYILVVNCVNQYRSVFLLRDDCNVQNESNYQNAAKKVFFPLLFSCSIPLS